MNGELSQHAAVTYSRGTQTQTPLSRSPSHEDGLEGGTQVGRETKDALRRRLEAEFEVEKERLEKEIRMEEGERIRIDRLIVGRSARLHADLLAR